MKMSWSGAALSACVLGLAAGAAHAEEAWKTVAEKPYVVKVRARPGSEAKDVWAEGELAASAADVQAVLRDVDAYRRWMPYVKESAHPEGPAGRGAAHVHEAGPAGGVLARLHLQRGVGVQAGGGRLGCVLAALAGDAGCHSPAARHGAHPAQRGELARGATRRREVPCRCTASPWTRPAPFLASWRAWGRRTPWRTRSARWRSAPGNAPNPGHERSDAGAPQPMQGSGRGAQALRVFRAVAPRTARHAS